MEETHLVELDIVAVVLEPVPLCAVLLLLFLLFERLLRLLVASLRRLQPRLLLLAFRSTDFTLANRKNLRLANFGDWKVGRDGSLDKDLAPGDDLREGEGVGRRDDRLRRWVARAARRVC